MTSLKTLSTQRCSRGTGVLRLLLVIVAFMTVFQGPGLLAQITSSTGADSWGRTRENFVNWENPHVHPLDRTPDGTRLVAVNTADNSLMVFDISGSGIAQIATIPVGLDPVSVRARSNSEVWVVNHVSDSVSIVDLNQQRVIATLQTDDEPADVVFAGSPQRAFVSISQENRLNVFDLANLNAAPQSVFINGEDPRALAVSPDGNEVYVAIFESGNSTTAVTGGKSNSFEVDLVRRSEGPYGGLGIPPNDGDDYNPPLNPDAPRPPAVSMIVRKDDSGRWMDDNEGDWSRFVSGDLAGLGGSRGGRTSGWDLPDRDVAIINAQTLEVEYQTRLMTTLMAIAVHPTTGEVTVVGTEATNEIRWEPNLQSTFVRVNLARFEAGGNSEILDLNPHLNYNVRSVPQAERDRSVGDPRGIVWNGSGSLAYITGMGSNNVIAINNEGERLGRIEVGEGPTGIVLNEAQGRAFVLNKFEGSISVIDLTSETETTRVSFFDPTPGAIKKGRKHLYDTHRTSGLGQVSCASCHVDGRTDRLSWDLGNPAGEGSPMSGISVDTGNPIEGIHPALKGPLLTQTLQDVINSPSMHWSGDKADIGHFAGAFANLQGTDVPLSDEETDEFEKFLDSIHIPPNPNRSLDNSFSELVEVPGPNGSIHRVGNADAGRQQFENSCRRCHPGHTGRSDRIRPSGGFGLNVFKIAPTWRNFHERTGLWFDDASGSNSGFGFQQDGSFDSEHNESRSSDMMAFMLSFNGRFPYTPSGQNETNESKDTHAAVGKQVTIGSNASSSESDMLEELLRLADLGEIGLVSHATLANQPRGFAYLGSGRFQSDQESEVLTETGLLNQISNNESLTYTAVPAGSEIRIGIDRDSDGVLNQDEILQGSNALDPTVEVAQTRGTITDVSSQGTVSQSDNLRTVNLDHSHQITSIEFKAQAGSEDELNNIHVYVRDLSGERIFFRSPFQNRNDRQDSPDSIVVDLVELTGSPVEGQQVHLVRTGGDLPVIANMEINVVDVIDLRVRDQLSVVGQSINFALDARTVDGRSLSFSATGLPDGLALDSESGVISGAASRTGIYEVSVTVVDDNDSVNKEFSWEIINGFTPCDAPTNVASGGSASQSSNFAGDQFLAGLAIDGDLTNFTHTARGQSPASWELVLDDNYAIHEIVLHNRSSNGSRLRDITVSIIDEFGNTIIQSPLLNPENVLESPDQLSYDLVSLTSRAIGGRTVRVERTSDPDLSGGTGNADESDVLSLAEVEVFACDVPVNTPPALAALSALTNTVGDAVNLTLTATDAEDDPLSFSGTGLPSGLTISQSGIISGAPDTAGAYNVAITVNDGNGGNDAVNFTWTVNGAVLAENDLLTNFVAPAVVQQGEDVVVTINYETTGTNELHVWLQDSNSGWRTVATDNLTLSPGVGSHTFNLAIAGNARVGDGYIWAIRLLPPGWATADDALSADYILATVQTGTGGGGGEPSTDQLGGVTFPSVVSSPGDVTFEVPYEVTETRELRVWLHDPENGFSSIVQGGAIVERGFGTHTFSLPVLPNARIGDGYLWALRLLPIDWATADDALDAQYLEASSELGTGGGNPTRDVFVSVDSPATVQAAGTSTLLIEYETTERREIGIWLHDVNDNWRNIATEVRTIEAGFGNEVFTLGVASDARLGDGHLWAIRLLPEGWVTSDDALDEFYQDVTVAGLDDNNTFINLATEPGVTATQSSIFGQVFTADLAIDGNTDGDWRNGSVTHTELDVNAWWEVDLGSVQDINHINIGNRTDCCGDEWLSAYHVLVSDVPFSSSDLNASIAQAGVSDFAFATAPSSTERVEVNHTGRYVRVQLTGSNFLALAEVEVFGPGEIFQIAQQVAMASDGTITNDTVYGDTNMDGDLLDLTAEYALGRNPFSPDSGDPGMALDLNSESEAVSLTYERPARLSQVEYLVEVSGDLETWSPMYEQAENVSAVRYGQERITFPHLELESGISRDRGFARLRITHRGWNTETTTPIIGWYETNLHPGYQTHGLSLNRPSSFSSAVQGWTEDEGMSLAAEGVRSQLQDDRAYYVEFVSGTLAGHRVDVHVSDSTDTALKVDWTAAHNTLQAIPDTSDWFNARMQIRPHWNLGEAYPVDVFVGAIDPTQADQLHFFNGVGYDSYFLLKAGDLLHWVAQEDDNLLSVNGHVIPPGIGTFMQRPEMTEPLTLTYQGEVRDSAFIQPLSQGYNLLAAPRPVDMSFTERKLTLGEGFTGARGPEAADQIQLWNGDSTIGGEGFQSLFLLDAGPGHQYWTEVGPDLLDGDNDRVFRRDRAFFLNLAGPDRPDYRVPKAD